MECRICGNEHLKLYYNQGNKDQYEFYKCSNCKVINLKIPEKTDQNKYAYVYINPLDKNHKQNKDHFKTYRFIKKIIGVKGKYLDIGCGNGRLLDLFRKDGWNVHGLELSQFLADKIKEHLGIEVTVANFLDYESKERYNLVTLRHVLEHLPDPILAMKKINNLLEEGGTAELEFPNIEGLSLRFKRFFNRLGLFKKKYSDDYIPGHCNEYSKKSFKYLLSITGFELVKWVTYSSKPITNLLYYYIPIGCKARVIIRKKQTI